MPIRPENKARYPKDWEMIRSRILIRSKGRCEWCGLKNHAYGFREKDGSFFECLPSEANGYKEIGYKPFKIVLTVAHMDHIPENCSDDNLKALCQKCHNAYDAPARAAGRKARRRAKT